MKDIHVRILVHGANATEYQLYKSTIRSINTQIFFITILSFVIMLYYILWKVYNWKISLQMSFITISFGLYSYIAQGKVIIEESILVLPTVGIQLSSTSYNGSKIYKFLPQENITAIVINEGITFSKVIYYMAFMVNGERNMILPFQSLQPRLSMLQPIYMEIKRSLFPDQKYTKMTLPTIYMNGVQEGY